MYFATVSANGPGDRSSIAGRVIPQTQKMVLDAALLINDGAIFSPKYMYVCVCVCVFGLEFPSDIKRALYSCLMNFGFKK